MNKKICNKTLSILNFVAFAIFYLFGIWGLIFKFGLEYSYSAMPFASEYQNILIFFNIIFIVLTLINIFLLVQNRKEKKLLYWYCFPIVHYLMTSISLFKVDLPEFMLAQFWAIAPAIFFIYRLIKEIRNKRKKKVLIWQLVGIALCIIMFFIGTYSSMVWLLISSVMLFIHSQDLEDDSKIIKKINTGIIILSIVLLLIGIIRCFILVSNMHKVDDETVDYISQVRSSLLDKDRNSILISVCKNNKWGYVNANGEEIVPCEYDCVSQEASNSNGIVKYNFYFLKKGNEYTLIANNGDPIATRMNSPVPWLTGDVFNSVEQNDSLILLSARESLRECLQSDIEYINPTTNKKIEYDDIEYTDDSDSIYVLNLDDNYVLEFEEIYTENTDEDEKYLIRLKKDGKVIESYNNMYVGNIYDLTSYTNGDIPFYNLKNGIHGYFSIKNKKFTTLKGQYEILDVVNDTDVIIRDWRNTSNTKDIIVRQGKGTTIKGLSISYIGNGYIVKKENKKFVFFDNDFNELTDEYDLILDDYIKYGVLICININNDKTEYYLSDLEGNILNESPYDIIYFNITSENIENYDLTNTSLHQIYSDYYENYDGSETSNDSSEEESTKKTFNKNSPLFKITTADYGKYIDLGKDVIGTNNTNDDWQILYNDTENGKLYAILADYLPTENEVFKSTGLRANYSVYSTVSRDELIKGLESEKWNELISENLKDSVKVQGAVSADVLMNSYNEKHKTNFYYTSGKTYLYNEPNNESSGVDKLYVLTGVEDDSNELNNEYLTISPVQNSTNLMRIINENGKFDTKSYREGSGVRPVAIISYDAQISTITSKGDTYFQVIK